MGRPKRVGSRAIGVLRVRTFGIEGVLAAAHRVHLVHLSEPSMAETLYLLSAISIALALATAEVPQRRLKTRLSWRADSLGARTGR